MPSPSTQAPVFTNPIIKYFLQRQALRTTTHKPLTIVTTPKTTSTTTLKTIPLNGQPLTKDEIKQHEQDLASINNDLGLLSTLLGRPISQGEVLRLARQNRTIATKSTSSQNSLNALPSKSVKATPSTASFTLLPTTPASLNMQAENIKHLQGLLSGDAMPTKAVEAEFYGKTNDALLAALLKQQGIGPIYNNLPVDVNCTLFSFLYFSLIYPILECFFEHDNYNNNSCSQNEKTVSSDPRWFELAMANMATNCTSTIFRIRSSG